MMMMMMMMILTQFGLLLLLLSVDTSLGFDGGQSLVVLTGRRRGGAQVRSLSSLPLLSSSSSLAREGGGGGGGEEEGEVRFRCGRSDDEPTIAFTMAKELMNPLGISYKNFVVAEDIQTGDRVGWAQIRPLGSSGTDPSRYNSSPGSISTTTTTIKDDVDDTIWEEFENDTNIEFPSFWSTLPWSKEYRAASKSANERRDRREQLVAEEIKKIKQRQPQLWELASVYVISEKRSEGIGSNLVRSVLEQHRQSFRKGGGGDDVYALTLSRTVDWYTKSFGFVEEKNIPKPMEFEVAAGNVITKLMGNELICLRLPFDKIGEEGVGDKR